MSDCVGGRKQQNFDKGTRQVYSSGKGKSSSGMSVYNSSAEESVRHKSTNDRSVYNNSSEEFVDFRSNPSGGQFKTGKKSSVYTSSEEIFQYTCDPCSTAGDHVEVKGFCTDCEEYLCDNCFRNHPRNKASRHYTLLDKNSMPKKAVKLCDPCKLVCDEEEAEGYCKDCQDYLCSTCFKSHSRNKASRQHVLLGKDNMPKSFDKDIVTSAAAMSISKELAENKKYEDTYSFIRDIDVRTVEANCSITGIALLANTDLVLVDQEQRTLKLLDIESDVIKGSLKLETHPMGITTISPYQIAVALPYEQKIQIISARASLSKVRALNTHGGCLEIKFTNNKIYASFFAPVKFQVIQLTGAVRKTINPDSEVLKHCNAPRYIAISPDESLIYMSDWENNKVLCIDMNGNMIYNVELEYPREITISPSGRVYLCSMKKHAVYKLTSDLRVAVMILKRGNGLFRPRAMCFNAAKQQLYISSAVVKNKSVDVLKVYQW